MSSRRAVALAESSALWRDVFALQQSGHYSLALDIVKTLTSSSEGDLATSLLAQVYEVVLENLTRIRSSPVEKSIPRLKDISQHCRKLSFYDVLFESQLTIYDLLFSRNLHFSEDFSEVFKDLTKSEQQMDSQTLRRWLRRKAVYLRRAGQVSEALQLLGYLVRSVGISGREEADNSLCSVYYELGRLQTQLGRYNEAAETFQQSLTLAFAIPNRTAVLLRLANVLERCGRVAQANIRRDELFALWGTGAQPELCYLCNGSMGDMSRLVLPCCRDVVHCTCAKQAIDLSAASNLSLSGQQQQLSQVGIACPSCGETGDFVDIFRHFQDLRGGSSDGLNIIGNHSGSNVLGSNNSHNAY